MAVSLLAWSLVTVAEVAAFVGRVAPAGASAEEDNYHRVMNAVADGLEGYCNRRLKDHGSSITETHSIREVAKTKLFPEHYPVGVVTSIHEDHDRVFGAAHLVAAADYVVAGKGRSWIEMLPGGRFSIGVEHVQLIYTAGFEAAGAPAVPEDLKSAALYTIADRFKDAGYDDFGGKKFGIVESHSRGGESITYETRDPFPKKAMTILDRYRRRGF